MDKRLQELVDKVNDKISDVDWELVRESYQKGLYGTPSEQEELLRRVKDDDRWTEYLAGSGLELGTKAALYGAVEMLSRRSKFGKAAASILLGYIGADACLSAASMVQSDNKTRMTIAGVVREKLGYGKVPQQPTTPPVSTQVPVLPTLEDLAKVPEKKPEPEDDGVKDPDWIEVADPKYRKANRSKKRDE